MKKALLKDTIKEIKNTYKRFISILLMAFLGVGFFAGIRASSPDMVDTIDKYYKNQNVYDIQVLSTMGLTSRDIEALEKIENVEIVEESFETDGKIELENKEIVAKVINIRDVNKPVLLEGKLPQNEAECLVEKNFLLANNKKVGDIINVEIEDSTNDDGEKIAYLKQKEMKIVGTVQSPLYISKDRGNSNLGAGKVNYYIYIPQENIAANEIYTSIYIKVKDANKYKTSTKKYEDYIEDIKGNIEEIKEERENARYNDLVGKANKKVEEAQNELNTKKAEAEEEIKKAEKDIQDGKNKVKSAEKEINQNKKKADSEFANGEKEISNAKAEIQKQSTAVDEAIKNGVPGMEAVKQQIEQSKVELGKKENELKNTKSSTYKKIENAKRELGKSNKKIADGEEELKKNKKEFEEKITEAEQELKDAKDKILEIEKAKWYVLDRNANYGYVGFIQDSKSIENIGKVFPVVFFIVAVLISLTSMTRMVEEQRLQIGTLKALGYNKLQIMGKYIIYASLACIIGGLLGMGAGFVALPKLLWMLYSMLYEMTDIVISFNWEYGGIGLVLIFICIVGATVYATIKELIQEPAVLMRPKAPKMGNRVLLEKIPFIWKRLNFSNKVTVRNLFRYKKRFYMTIVGILGCTALILTGFGIKDSVTRLIPNQFEKIFVYDMQINLKDSLSQQEKEEFIKVLGEKEKFEKIVKVYMSAVTLKNGENSENSQIIVAEDNFDDVINIVDVNKNEKVELKENEICITDKVAQLLDVNEGDSIFLKNDDKDIEIKISNIVENYVSHYVFMTKQTYENVYQEEYKTNVLLTKNVELSKEEQEKLATEIMNKSEVAGITDITSTIKPISDMMSSLNYVVLILIVSAGLLAFVVLYNLSNVNISERIRELATIKVLGFYDKEVYRYVTRETIILTVIGIALGLIFGYLLNYYIMQTCEINILRFTKSINPISYFYAIIITVGFTVIVNIATYVALKKIDMIESLKSVE